LRLGVAVFRYDALVRRVEIDFLGHGFDQEFAGLERGQRDLAPFAERGFLGFGGWDLDCEVVAGTDDGDRHGGYLWVKGIRADGKLHQGGGNLEGARDFTPSGTEGAPSLASVTDPVALHPD
jgi:hypothetical protein